MPSWCVAAVEAHGIGFVTRLERWTYSAHTLRRDLRDAGVTRADIFARDEGRRPLTYHDLRATGVTWQALRGDAPTMIQERVGHAHLTATEGYMRRGRLMALAAGEVPFPPIPACLLVLEKK